MDRAGAGRLTSKHGFATLLDSHEGRPASAGLGALMKAPPAGRAGLPRSIRSGKIASILLAGFTKVGAVCYGGGVLSIASLRKSLVDKGALSKKEFEEGLSLSNAIPGFILTNLAVFAGIRSVGVLVAIGAIVGAVLPSSLAMVVATQLLLHYREMPAVGAALKSVQPVTLAILAVMVVRLAPRGLASWSQAGIAAGAAVAILAFKVHPGVLLATVGSAALLLGLVRPGTRPQPVEESPGTIYLAAKPLPRLADVRARCHVFIAIDRASCWVCIGVGRSNTPYAALDFVARLRQQSPLKVSTLVIGKGASFAELGRSASQGRGGFIDACRRMGIRVRIAGQDAVPPHQRIEQFNQRLKQVLQRQRMRSFSAVQQSLARYAWLHNECVPQKTQLGGTPTEILQHWWVAKPQVFARRPARQLAMSVG